MSVEERESEVSMSVFEILRGAIDIHMHPGPDIGGLRRLDFVEAAKQACEVGMRAIVLKPLSYPTMDRAYAAKMAVPGIEVFGGIMLDRAVGGLNPKAVKTAVEQWKAKVVYFPVFFSAYCVKRSAGSKLYSMRLRQLGADPDEKGITILGRGGKILPEVEEILNIIAENKGVVVDTAHLSPEESLILIEEARKRGIEKITVSHPTAAIIDATPEQQKEMAKRGAYLVQTCAQLFHMPEAEDPKKILEAIKTAGPEHCCMATDCGHINYPPPVEALRIFTKVVMEMGITESQINMMIKENPARILGLT